VPAKAVAAPAEPVGAGPPRPRRGLLPGLAITETVSWGVCYYGFAVLVPAMEREFGWSRATLVGAFTVAVIVSGLGAFPVGRWLDRGSARLLMTAGSVLATLGVLAWSQARSVAAFYGAWLVLGAAMALVLYEPAQVVLVKQFRSRATRAITALTLVAGFASTIFQPTIAVMQDAWGWRRALVVLAIGLGVVTVTIHACVLPGRVARAGRRRDAATVVARASAPNAIRDPAMAGLTVAFALSIGAMSAAIVHLIPYLTDHGWTNVAAAVAAGLIGVTQVAARVVFGLFAERVPPPRLAFAVLAVPVAGIVVLAASDGAAIAWVAVALLGIGQGTSTLLRPLVLARRLPAAVYGRGAASSAAWSTVARAVAPLLLAAAAGAGARGYPIGLAVSAAAGLAGAALAWTSLLVPPPTVRPATTVPAAARTHD
jgi:predicted MFS family arabinose efflux permease